MNNLIESKLNQLHKAAEKDFANMAKRNARSFYQYPTPYDFKEAYLAITKKQGQDLRKLIIEYNIKNVVEFGTSLGISTIYLADGVRASGGNVVSSELLESKALIAKQNLKEVGLNEYVDIRIGDAIETLKNYTAPIDLLFLDGWKDIYLPLFKMLEPNFHKSTFIYADNMDSPATKIFRGFIENNSEKYQYSLIHENKAFLINISNFKVELNNK